MSLKGIRSASAAAGGCRQRIANIARIANPTEIGIAAIIGCTHLAHKTPTKADIQLPPMNKKQLSELYSKATQRTHDLVTDLYEDLHTNAGEPVESIEEIAAITNKYSRWFRSELDFIRSSVQEYKEQQ